jgi:outer membrane protein
MMKKLSLLVSATCLGIACQAQTTPQPDNGKLEVSLGLTRGTQSLFKGVLLRPRTDPLIIANWEKGRWFASTVNGAGYKLVHEETFTLGVAANYMPGRYEASEVRYRGMGDVSGTVSAYGWFEWQPVREVLTVYGNVAQSTRRSTGRLATVGATLALPLVKDVYAFVDGSANFADAAYLQSFYGVSAAQAANAGLARYAPSAGLLNSSLSLGLQFDFGGQYSLVASLGGVRNGNPVVSSPLAPQRTTASANLFLTRRF